jgi:hypothetical protein
MQSQDRALLQPVFAMLNMPPVAVEIGCARIDSHPAASRFYGQPWLLCPLGRELAVAYKPSEARYKLGGSVKYLVYQTGLCAPPLHVPATAHSEAIRPGSSVRFPGPISGRICHLTEHASAFLSSLRAGQIDPARP